VTNFEFVFQCQENALDERENAPRWMILKTEIAILRRLSVPGSYMRTRGDYESVLHPNNDLRKIAYI